MAPAFTRSPVIRLWSIETFSGGRIPTQVACTSSIFKQCLIILIEQHGSAGKSLQFCRATYVINVRVRHHDLLHRECVFG